MKADEMAKAIVATGSSTALVANMSTAGGLSVSAVGYGAYVGYGALKDKLDGSL